LGSRRASKEDLRIVEEVVTCKLYLGLAFTIPNLERVTIWCCEVGGGGGGGGRWLLVSVLFVVEVLIVELEVLIVELFVDLFVGLFVVVFVEEKAEGKDSFIKCDMTRNDNFVGVQVKVPVFAMIIRVPEKDKWCGQRLRRQRVKGIDHPSCHNEEGFDGCDKNISKVEGTIWIRNLYMTRVGDRKLMGILCVWEPTLFVKDNIISSDSLLAIMGTWVPSSSKLLINSVYSPQELTEKRVLWDYILRLIDRWDGDCVIMKDSNKVRTEQEIYGSAFNVQGANGFNSFISLASLIDLALDCYTYTWAHKTAIKIKDTSMSLATADSNGSSNEEILSNRSLLLKELNDVNSIDSLEADQKSSFGYRSKLMGIDTRPEKVDASAKTTDCLIFTTLFVHLGVKVGGGRLTLIKLVLTSIPSYHMSIFKVPLGALELLESIRRNFVNKVDGSIRKMAWISWNKVLPSKKYSGLIVSTTYGEDGALNSSSSLSKHSPCWQKIDHASMVDTFSHPPRGGAKEEQLTFLLSHIGGLILTNISNRWVWSIEDTDEFSVIFVRQLLDDLILPMRKSPQVDTSMRLAVHLNNNAI
nr:RNA-directed DNA polymerase, eukaryota [Tanacetum cinerariifolium]